MKMAGGRFVSLLLGATGFCIPVDQVLQIVRRENVLGIPKAPHFVTGVINLRGDVVPVIDLHARLGIPDVGGRRKRILVVGLGTRSYGLMVDEVMGIVEAAEDEIVEGPSACSEFTRGFMKRGEGSLHILDLTRIVSQERVQTETPTDKAAG
jgi:purine-binding chemotaxis protein CheW